MYLGEERWRSFFQLDMSSDPSGWKVGANDPSWIQDLQCWSELCVLCFI